MLSRELVGCSQRTFVQNALNDTPEPEPHGVLADAVAFGQWKAARRLVERGAQATLWQAAALGLLDRLNSFFASANAPEAHEITTAFWCACHGGECRSAEYLLERGADLNWIGFDGLTPLDAARRNGAEELVAWLLMRGAKSATELR